MSFTVPRVNKNYKKCLNINYLKIVVYPIFFSPIKFKIILKYKYKLRVQNILNYTSFKQIKRVEKIYFSFRFKYDKMELVKKILFKIFCKQLNLQISINCGNNFLDKITL